MWLRGEGEGTPGRGDARGRPRSEKLGAKGAECWRPEAQALSGMEPQVGLSGTPASLKIRRVAQRVGTHTLGVHPERHPDSPHPQI